MHQPAALPQPRLKAGVLFSSLDLDLFSCLFTRCSGSVPDGFVWFIGLRSFIGFIGHPSQAKTVILQKSFVSEVLCKTAWPFHLRKRNFGEKRIREMKDFLERHEFHELTRNWDWRRRSLV